MTVSVSEAPNESGLCAEWEADRELQELIEHAAHVLPAQGPITAFVHHNTLHALEGIPFEEALRRAASLYDCRTLLPETEFRQLADEGRIDWSDVEHTLYAKLGDQADQLIGVLGTRFYIRRAMMRFPPVDVPASQLTWLLNEDRALETYRVDVPHENKKRFLADTRQWWLRALRYGECDEPKGRAPRNEYLLAIGNQCTGTPDDWDERTWEKVGLQLLWCIICQAVANLPAAGSHCRRALLHRDFLVTCTGDDPDQLVHGLLIRWCAAFLDQGLAAWQLPGREAGFYRAFLETYGLPWGPPDAWLRGFSRELRRLKRSGVSPYELIRQSLADLGVPREEWASYIEQTLLALRGFAGQIWQMEQRPDRYGWAAPRGTLVEFLAIRLLLDRWAIAYIAREKLGYRGNLAALRDLLAKRLSPDARDVVAKRSWAIFQLAQALSWTPRELYALSNREWQKLVEEVESFDSIERRLIWLEAFELGYYRQVFDALCLHNAAAQRSQPQPRYQVLFCIDEREESIRRHLEEVDPECETFGFAGFFGVAMYYRGLSDPHYLPLCPIVIRPETYVTECPNYVALEAERVQAKARRSWGWLRHWLHLASRSFWSGAITGWLGSLTTLPLVMRVLFPRTTAIAHRMVGKLLRPSLTQLQLECSADRLDQRPKHGFTVAEMASIVGNALRTIGLTRGFSPLVLVIGHGSSSLNNPHEAAHDCGACGGARGGPNARAFAQMANDGRVRRKLVAEGLVIPDDVHFVGAYHNTCDDSLQYFDLERLPPTHYEVFQRAERALDAARRRNAHERCRRFLSADLGWSPEESLKHVEGRAEDLAQTRPEYGHCTNAVTIVGRRQRTRGLFLDRRAFLASYDCHSDPDGHILRNLLRAVIPVCAGISLEYYFSRVDPVGFGCSTKLPHNITSLLGVMDGAASDLRTGLPWQMVEIHEPMRMLFVIEVDPQVLQNVLHSEPSILDLVTRNWVRLAVLHPERPECWLYQDGQFQAYQPTTDRLPKVAQSFDWYRGWRGHLGFCSIRNALETQATCPSVALRQTDGHSVPSESVWESVHARGIP